MSGFVKCRFDTYGFHGVSCDSLLADGECTCGKVKRVCIRCLKPAGSNGEDRACTEQPHAHQDPRMTDAPQA